MATKAETNAQIFDNFLESNGIDYEMPHLHERQVDSDPEQTKERLTALFDQMREQGIQFTEIQTSYGFRIDLPRIIVEFDDDETASEQTETSAADVKIDLPKVKIENMESNRGNTMPNQFRIFTDAGVYFQSYQSVIAYKRFSDGKIFLDADTWNYSRTTSRYRCKFLNERGGETQKKIDSGEYTLANLN